MADARARHRNEHHDPQGVLQTSRDTGGLHLLDGVAFYVYGNAVSASEIHGQAVTDAQIQAWSDEAEAGYDVAVLRRRGRPTAGEGPGTVVPVRLDAATLAALNKRAAAEGLTNRSEAIRAAVRAWALAG